jgi:hypothetical protein
VAGVGLSEEEAIAKGLRYVKGVNPYAKSAMGDARVSDHGFAKLLIEVGLAPQHGPVVARLWPNARVSSKRMAVGTETP